MKGRPVSKEQRFVSLAIVRFQVATARGAVVNPKTRFSFDVQHCQPMIIRSLAEGTACAPEPPAGGAAAASEVAYPAWVYANQLAHRRRGTAGRTITAKPSFLASVVAPLVEGQ